MSTKFLAFKRYSNLNQAVADIKSGSTLLVGGFGLSGNPQRLINEIEKTNLNNLTVVSNNCGITDYGLGVLLKKKMIKRMISSYVGENKEFERQYFQGELEVELTPQGTLAEKLRSGGAGIPAFFTPTGYGTIIQEGGFPIKLTSDGKPLILSAKKEVREFNGINYVMEESIRGDFALIKAHKADKKGNLIFRKTARNFNQDCATAGRVCIAEVDEIVDGYLNPDEIHLPGNYVHRIVQGDRSLYKLEKKVFNQVENKTKKPDVKIP